MGAAAENFGRLIRRMVLFNEICYGPLVSERSVIRCDLDIDPQLPEVVQAGDASDRFRTVQERSIPESGGQHQEGGLPDSSGDHDRMFFRTDAKRSSERRPQFERIAGPDL